MSWTDERVEKLKELWTEGMSASQIAMVLGGVTRNAVIGKVHRLGLSNRSGSGGSDSSKAKPAAKAMHRVRRVGSLIPRVFVLKPGLMARIHAG